MKCKGRLKSNSTATEINIITDHSCIPSPTLVHVERVKSSIRYQAKNSRLGSSRNVISELIVNQTEATLVKLPDLKSLEKNVNRIRRINNNLGNTPRNISEINIPDELKLTLTNPPENFLCFDSGVNDPERLIIFASNTDLIRLSKCHCWLADATFKVSKLREIKKHFILVFPAIVLPIVGHSWII